MTILRKVGRKQKEREILSYHFLMERTHSIQLASISNRSELSVVAMLDEMSQAVTSK